MNPTILAHSMLVHAHAFAFDCGMIPVAVVFSKDGQVGIQGGMDRREIPVMLRNAADALEQELGAIATPPEPRIIQPGEDV